MNESVGQYELSIIYDGLVKKVNRLKKGLSLKDFKRESIFKKEIPNTKLFWSNKSIIETLYNEIYL